MDKANRDGIAKLQNDSHAPANVNSYAGPTNFNTKDSRDPTTQKRTRSQLNVPNLILRLPLSRSPLKDARKARAREQAKSSSTQTQWHPQSSRHSQSVIQGGAGSESVMIEAEVQATLHGAEEEEEMTETSTERAQRREEEEEEEKMRRKMRCCCLLGRASGTKKRTSPDTDTARLLPSPSGERQPKRAKVEALRLLGRMTKDHCEYDQPLRDPDASPPNRSKGYVRAESTKPMPSPNKMASSSIFPPRAKSVPLEGESGVRAIDLTAVPLSPRRSPSRTGIEIRRAPSLPPSGADGMDIDSDEATALAHFTNVSVPSPQSNAPFNYTVNFATPRGFATPAARAGYPVTTPLSPLTPLPPTPFVDRLPSMQSLLAKSSPRMQKEKSSLYTTNDATDMEDDIPTSPIDITMNTQMNYFSNRCRNDNTTHYTRATAIFSRLPRPSTNPSSNSTELMPPPPVPEKAKGRARAVTVAGTSGQTGAGTWAGTPSITTSTDRCSHPTLSSSQSEPKAASVAMAKTRPSVIGAMKPKRGPSAPLASRRVTRSVSMKEERVKSDSHANEIVVTGGDEPRAPVAYTSTGSSTAVPAIPLPSTTTTSKPRPPESIDASASKPKPPPAVQKAVPSTCTSKTTPDASKLRQTSLNLFIKAKPHVAMPASSGGPAAATSTNSGTLLRAAPPYSPSKIPLPISPAKRPSTTKRPEKLKTPSFSLGSTSSGFGAGAGTWHSWCEIGRTLAHHALARLGETGRASAQSAQYEYGICKG
ncbi:hypothetical protein BU15DRAFT_72312 [Melanogaster broomeanus]|nr:hypothetical protein BU15DRAFT_72312 [Melanogaster broomeanus]